MYAHSAPALFSEWLAGLKKLAGRIEEIETSMGALARNFAKAMPGCRLILYAKRQSRPGPPRGLYWGRLTRSGLIFQKRGRLNRGMIWRIGMRSSKVGIFWAFDRERRYFNRTRSMLVKAREDLRKVLTVHSLRPLPVAFSSLLADLAPLRPRDYPIVRGLYNLAFEAESVQSEMGRLVSEFRASIHGPFRIISRNQILRLYFGIGRRCIPPEGLSKRQIRQEMLDEPIVSLLVGLRKRAIVFHRDLSFHRRRYARVRHLLSRAEAEIPIRRRRPQQRRVVLGWRRSQFDP